MHYYYYYYYYYYITSIKQYIHSLSCGKCHFVTLIQTKQKCMAWRMSLHPVQHMTTFSSISQKRVKKKRRRRKEQRKNKGMTIGHFYFNSLVFSSLQTITLVPYLKMHTCQLSLFNRDCPYFDPRKRVKKELFDDVSLFLQKSVYSKN